MATKVKDMPKIANAIFLLWDWFLLIATPPEMPATIRNRIGIDICMTILPIFDYSL